MIAYLDKRDDKQEIVFAQVTGDRNLIRKKIDNSTYGDVVDKLCLKKYLYEAMLNNYCNFYNEAMCCNPNDILENIDIDFDKLEKIFSDIDYNNFIKNVEVYANRLLMLYLEVMPLVKIKEIDRVSYDKSKKYKEGFINSLNLNTKILNMMKIRNDSKYNYDFENVESILNDDSIFDDCFVEDTVLDMDNDEVQSKVKKLELTRENAETGAKILID